MHCAVYFDSPILSVVVLAMMVLAVICLGHLKNCKVMKCNVNELAITSIMNQLLSLLLPIAIIFEASRCQ